ncbi:MAG: hypothetical protein MZV49_19745 [Rhodopseudomonas palustris]|nr:hypothetical protein [Rhodopseudomonas palustris]
MDLEVAHFLPVSLDQVDVAAQLPAKHPHSDNCRVALPEYAVGQEADLCRHNDMFEPLLFQEAFLLVPPCKILVDELVDYPPSKTFTWV